jgi:hypothetical protein
MSDMSLAAPDHHTVLDVRHQRLIPVSAVFADRTGTERAVAALTCAGVPRDLVEVAATPEALRRHFAGFRPMSTREVTRFAAIGGLVGLGIGILISLVIVSLPRFVGPGSTALVQLLGPNACTVGGAVIGAAAGFLRRRSPAGRHARAAEVPESIVVVVRARGQEQVPALLGLLAESGGREPRVEAVQ